ncbi:MAG: hypothetical protein [Wendovervirus sonii]|uniref:Uncharacterized protein n=1 Tax=phage Lak_Megaphage_Sonny TaxID=3109229 RepID=A0ABZ0Z3J8_9CAUD|nr:MAG: hypothetical protein [phage Lak_Megaphage_Sonny]
MAQNNIEITNWMNLDLYTKEFKEWIEKLFRKAHARMGHIEEDLAKLKRKAITDYRMETSQSTPTQIDVVLRETVSGEAHGSFTIKTDGTVEITKWEEAGSHPLPR